MAPSKRMFVFAELTLALRQQKELKRGFCFVMIIRPIFVVRRIGKSVEIQIICHSVENVPEGLFLGPDSVVIFTCSGPLGL